jgi:tetratricopeptide (TPR) repeat protein/Mn-dependent DtxR family transcriptional regulator
MSRVSELNLPPKEIYEPPIMERKNFEHIILWMLKNNESVEWSHFKEEPINIPQSTLSNYLKELQDEEYIQKAKRGVYKITAMGEIRYNELSQTKDKKRRLNYPPKLIRDKRNYDHTILWMAYNNNFLKWSDFLEEPLSINNSSLSKSIRSLLNREALQKNDEKEYQITRIGKAEYARMLRTYDLDRQSILNEESKRIEEITMKTIGFFEKYDIVNSDIKFRFLNNVLTLPFEKLTGSIDTEEQFNKVLLYLSINHPNQYPSYISTDEFSEKYVIDKLDLEFNIRKIIEKGVYTTKFFKLETDEDKTYFFQANEKLEKVLSAITEDYITKFTYLNKLYEKSDMETLPLTIESTVDAILNEICDNLFDINLKGPLRDFLPGYINYLAYKMETQKRLEDITDKLEGTIWQEFQYYSAAAEAPKNLDETQENYYISPEIYDILEQYYTIPSTAKAIKEGKKRLKDKMQYKKALSYVNSKINGGLNNKEFMLFKARVLCHMNQYTEAIKLIDEVIAYEKYREDEGIYISSSFILVSSYTALGIANEALEIVEDMFEHYPDHPISLAAKALVYGYSKIYDFDVGEVNDDYVLDLIDEAIRTDSSVSNMARYYQLKAIVLEQMQKYEEALEEIEIAMEMTDEVVDLYSDKLKILSELKRYEEAFEVVEEAMERHPDNRKHLLMQKAYLYKMQGDSESGLDIITELTKTYPDYVDFFNHKAYWHIYIYNQKKEKGIEDEENKNSAIATIKWLTEKVPQEGNYFDSYGEILMITGDYENAIKKYEKAIKTEPNGWFIPSSYVGLGKCNEKLGNYEEAKENFQKARKIVRYCFCHIKNKKEWIEDIENHLNRLKELR